MSAGNPLLEEFSNMFEHNLIRIHAESVYSISGWLIGWCCIKGPFFRRNGVCEIRLWSCLQTAWNNLLI